MTLLRVVSMAVLLVCIFLFGYWLSHTGKPLNMIILTIHKLLSLAAVALLVLTMFQLHRVAPLSMLEFMTGVVTGGLFLITIVTGGLLGTGKTMPAMIMTIHQIVPFLTALSTAVTFYLLFTRK